MAAAAESIRMVLEHAGRLPGISVLGHESSQSEVRIFITARSAAAIDSMQFLALSANVDVQPWVKHPCQDAEVHQTLFVRLESRDTLEHGELQILGIHIVWRLHRLRLMSAFEANPILRNWHAVEVDV